ncbi:neurofibromin [Anaeramoeba ignava]|uniref:Neurofibromin n=1 Tax=Anaeramoeba ignava TaxID=1746090 RepID=A0A9Q0LBF3_ANAIG|nr:neurofibromin [Anaeramoeba ignava]
MVHSLSKNKERIKMISLSKFILVILLIGFISGAGEVISYTGLTDWHQPHSYIYVDGWFATQELYVCGGEYSPDTNPDIASGASSNEFLNNEAATSYLRGYSFKFPDTDSLQIHGVYGWIGRNGKLNQGNTYSCNKNHHNCHYTYYNPYFTDLLEDLCQLATGNGNVDYTLTPSPDNWATVGDNSSVQRNKSFGGLNDLAGATWNYQSFDNGSFGINMKNVMTHIGDVGTTEPLSIMAYWDCAQVQVNYTYSAWVTGYGNTEGRGGSPIQVNLTGNVVANGQYNNLTIHWKCKYQDVVSDASFVNPPNSITCTLPDISPLNNGTLYVTWDESKGWMSGTPDITILAGCTNDSECGHGTCNTTSSNCICEQAYMGYDCSVLKCPDGIYQTCNNNGWCDDSGSVGFCWCNDSYSGQYCDVNLCERDHDNCNDDAPNSNNYCSYEGTEGGCICDPTQGWTGPNCTEQLCNGTDCNNGTCVVYTGLCSCNVGYFGDNCEFKYCNDSVDLCNGNGDCINQTGGCLCYQGWTGEHCNISWCEGIDCGDHGYCDQMEGHCVCDDHWTGELCETEVTSDKWADKMGDKLNMSGAAFLAFFSTCMAALGIILVAAAFIFWKKRHDRDKWAHILALPIFTVESLFGENFYISPQDRKKLKRPNIQSANFDLQQLLIENMILVDCLCIASETKVASYLGRSLLYIFEANGESPQLLKYFITKEVSTCDDGDLLFRGYSMASKLWGAYCHLAYGINYIHGSLSETVHELMVSQDMANIELDPNRIDTDTTPTVNKYNLMAAVQAIFSSILKNVDNFPPQFRFVLSHLKEEVLHKFPDRVSQSLGGMVVLRYFSPAITASDEFGLLKEPPSDELLRTLILVAKVLQNLANGTLFGAKEEYMNTVNDFISTNEEKMINYLDSISTPNDESRDELSFESSPLPKDVLEISCANIHRYVSLNKTEIVETMQTEIQDEQKFNDLLSQLEEILDRLGDPINVQADEDV